MEDKDDNDTNTDHGMDKCDDYVPDNIKVDVDIINDADNTDHNDNNQDIDPTTDATDKNQETTENGAINKQDHAKLAHWYLLRSIQQSLYAHMFANMSNTQEQRPSY